MSEPPYAETEPEPAPESGPAPEPESARGASGALSPREQGVLALERRGWASAGAKERAVREELGLAPVRYYQLLNALLDDPRALAHDPVTVNRLRRVRDARREER